MKAKTVKLPLDKELQLLESLKKVPALWSSGHDYLHIGKDDKVPMWKELGKPYNLSGKYFTIT